MPSGKPCGAAVSIEAAIAPIRGKLLVQFRMQREAALRQRREGCPIAPVTRQKPTRFSGSGTGKRGAFDDRCFDTPAAEEVGDRGTDHSATANQYMASRVPAFAGMATGRANSFKFPSHSVPDTEGAETYYTHGTAIS